MDWDYLKEKGGESESCDTEASNRPIVSAPIIMTSVLCS
jgi:hypothetical protein